jgi:hypothetical protein
VIRLDAHHSTIPVASGARSENEVRLRISRGRRANQANGPVEEVPAAEPYCGSLSGEA